MNPCLLRRSICSGADEEGTARLPVRLPNGARSSRAVDRDDLDSSPSPSSRQSPSPPNGTLERPFDNTVTGSRLPWPCQSFTTIPELGGETTDSCVSNRKEPGASEAKGWCFAVIARTIAAAHQGGKLGVTEGPRSCRPGASRRPGLLPTRRFPPCSPQKLFTWLSTGSERLFTPVLNWPVSVNRCPRRCLAGECPRRHITVRRSRSAFGRCGGENRPERAGI